MKRLLMSAVLSTALFTTGAMALDGTVAKIRVNQYNTVKVSFNIDGGTESVEKPLGGDVEARKAMLAVVLTAKSTNAPVTALGESVNGVDIWKLIVLK